MNKADALNDRGLRMTPGSDRAIHCFTAALRLCSTHAPAMLNLGDALRWRGSFAKADALYRRAVEAAPDFPAAHFRAGMMALLFGDLVRGWREYKWRMGAKGFTPFITTKPEWNGEPL